MCDLDLERENLEANQERILERLNSQDVVLERIVDQLKTLKGEEKKEERLLDNQDICQMLHVSKRTLQRYRSSGDLPYQMIYHKTFYKEGDVKEFIRKHFSKKIAIPE